MIPYENEKYWSERLQSNFSLGGVGNINASLALNRWSYRVRRAVLLRTLHDYKIKLERSNIFELGFGTGFYLDIWRGERAARVHGVDITDIAVDAASKRFGPLGWVFNKADAAQPLCPELTGEHLDLSVCFDVLHHITDDTKHRMALQNMSARLKPGGHLVIMDPVIFDPGYRQTYDPASWVRFRTLEQYRAAFEELNLALVAVRPVFFFLNSPTDISGFWRKFFNLSWRLTTLPDRLFRRMGLNLSPGALVGAAAYYPELVLGRVFRRGPSSHILIACKKGA